MKKFKIILVITSLFLGAIVYTEENKNINNNDDTNNHIEDHIHKGKMTGLM